MKTKHKPDGLSSQIGGKNNKGPNPFCYENNNNHSLTFLQLRV